jgi:hypothetical protein
MAAIYSMNSYHPLNGLGYILGRVRAELFAGLDERLASDELLSTLELTATHVAIIMTLALQASCSMRRIHTAAAERPAAARADRRADPYCHSLGEIRRRRSFTW